MAMLGIALVNMLVALDQTVVSTALPSIVSELKGFEYYAWIASIYMLASVVTVPVFGRLGDYFGRRRFVIASVVTFTGASVLCGLAPNMPFLVFARGLQGVGGGMMVGTAFASVPDLFPDARTRVRWQVVISTAYGIGTAAGPSLGGLLSEHFGWRSTFLVNLPVGLAALYFVWRYLPNFARKDRGRVQIDWRGAGLIAVVLGGFQVFIENVPAHGLSVFNAVLIAAVAAGVYWLLRTERRVTHPIVPLDMFRHPQMVVLFSLSMLTGFVMFSLIFFAPLLLQGGFGLSPQAAGLVATPLAGCIALGSFINTPIVVRLSRPTNMVTLGFCLLAVSAAGIALAHRDTPQGLIALAMAAAGIGLGFILNNLNVFGQEIAGSERFGITTALLQSTRMVGGMLGTTIVGTLVNHQYAKGVGAAVSAYAATPFAQAASRVLDPRILIDAQLRASLLADMHALGANGAPLVETARQTLVGSVHAGVLLTGIAALVAAWRVRRIRQIKFGGKIDRAALAVSE
ncbi:Multidrug resistance protein 3 [Pandoraea terrae]|uniref:Multidrug resistance protein 3 n=2 Tax=Pandoraea terrae TaxID=1537710 RepID=A0A5E4UN52_9BURK|nr:Multidrug resistance protein 3 [Pandoraea terrae]